MYSVVLAMAMTGAGDVPAGLLHHGCCGGSCYGSCYGGCSGYSCNGCGGGWSCSGCCGGYSCHGGHGHKHHGHKHHSCHGCCGGYSCFGCCGGYSCNGCYGGYSCSGCYGCGGGTVVPTVTPVVPGGKKGDKDGDGGTFRDPGPGKKGGKGDKDEAMTTAAPATIVVTLPAEARLEIDGAATSSTSERRVFVSPELNPGREYHYTLKAEWVRDGKTVSMTREVAVTAGTEATVKFETESVASR